MYHGSCALWWWLPESFYAPGSYAAQPFLGYRSNNFFNSMREAE
jgi:hypothetical protein